MRSCRRFQLTSSARVAVLVFLTHGYDDNSSIFYRLSHCRQYRALHFVDVQPDLQSLVLQFVSQLRQKKGTIFKFSQKEQESLTCFVSLFGVRLLSGIFGKKTPKRTWLCG